MNAKTIRSTKGRGMLYDSILDTVGDTPVVRINNLAPNGVRVYVKVESFNPAASIKDRLALNIIEAAERRHLEARADCGGSDQRQHWHRARNGLRAKRLSTGRDDGRQLFG